LDESNLRETFTTQIYEIYRFWGVIWGVLNISEVN